jgi:hypothetical protein
MEICCLGFHKNLEFLDHLSTILFPRRALLHGADPKVVLHLKAATHAPFFCTICMRRRKSEAKTEHRGGPHTIRSYWLFSVVFSCRKYVGYVERGSCHRLHKKGRKKTANWVEVDERLVIETKFSLSHNLTKRVCLSVSWSECSSINIHVAYTYISIKCERKARGMVRKSDTIHVIQSTSEGHTLQLASTRLEKSSADRFTSSHAKECTFQISLPTFQHTRSVLASD